ncbi:hypothetical protein H5410_014929 [Solanum commersonii]|uniref:Uncharacterized protein n=1 Tax=Solanum commersonii TaxID=4109 RepID=A0A9J5ZSB4_SOLCO|nr:hypothetical protein H5410_014929 [Solanum commersonii]
MTNLTFILDHSGKLIRYRDFEIGIWTPSPPWVLVRKLKLGKMARTRVSIFEDRVVSSSPSLLYGRGRGRSGVGGHEASPELIYKHDDVIEQQTEERGKTKPSLYSSSTFAVLPSTSGSTTIFGATLPVQGFGVGFQTIISSLVHSMAPSRFASRPISASTTMLVAEKKSFDGFFGLAPPMFDDTAGRKIYDFLTKFQDKFFNLGILEEATTSLLRTGGMFRSIIDHAKMIQSIQHARNGSGT